MHVTVCLQALLSQSCRCLQYIETIRQAEQNFKHALQLNLSNGDMHRLSECYVGLGKFYLERNKFDKAAENLFQALHIDEHSGITIAAPDIYELISKMYIRQNDFCQSPSL